jgi:hypothetical protein
MPDRQTHEEKVEKNVDRIRDAEIEIVQKTRGQFFHHRHEILAENEKGDKRCLSYMTPVAGAAAPAQGEYRTEDVSGPKKVMLDQRRAR